MKLNLIAIGIAAFSLASCGTTKNTESMDNKESKITDVEWVLEELDGQKVSQLITRERQIGFKLSAKDQKVNGFGGCNSFFAVYNVAKGNSIRFDAIGSTRMACPHDDFNESAFLQKLDMADTYAIENNKMILKQGETVLAVFGKADGSWVPAPKITDIQWRLQSLEGKEVSKKTIFFKLDSREMTVHGYAGCNNFNGDFTLEEGNRIRFGTLATTMMSCIDNPISESELFEVFDQADNYTIDGNTLSLNVGRRAPLAVFVAE